MGNTSARCKKCGGNLITDKDFAGNITRVYCLQCGQDHNEQGEMIIGKLSEIQPKDKQAGRDSHPGVKRNGGRPRSKTLAELSQQSLENNNNGGRRLPSDLKALKSLYKLKIKSGELVGVNG